MLDYNIVIKEIDTMIDNHIKGYRTTLTSYIRIRDFIKQYFVEYKKEYPDDPLENSAVARYLDQHKFFGWSNNTYGTPDELMEMIAYELNIESFDYVD